MKRREFITLLGGAAVTWPMLARAQQAMPVVGILSIRSAGDKVFSDLMVAFRKGLSDFGFVEGQNVTFDYRFGQGQFDRMPALMAELVSRRVNVMVAGGGLALVAKAATATIPVVVLSGSDPVKSGLIASLNRPGGNITGVNFFTSELGGKRIELLREIVPKPSVIAILFNPNNPPADIGDARALSNLPDERIVVLSAGTAAEIDAAFATLVQRSARGLIVGADSFFNARRDQIIALAAHHSVSTIYDERTFVADGGLMSYGTSVTDAYRQLGIYTAQILRGAKPADLPFVQPTKFELIINLKTAKALGLDVPAKLLALADEVIE